MSQLDIVAPGSTILIIDGGQLGEMTARAATSMGYKALVLGEHASAAPAGRVTPFVESLDRGKNASDNLLDKICEQYKPSVAVLGWENVPVDLLERLVKRGVPVRPGPSVLAVAQDRLLEKRCAEDLGILVPRYREVRVSNDCVGAHAHAQYDSILKTRRDGYDGKGQVSIKQGEAIHPAWQSLDFAPCVLEERINFQCEVSVIIARSPRGTMFYGPLENTHEKGILRRTVHPPQAPVFQTEMRKAVQKRVRSAALVLAQRLHVHGLLAVEFFVMEDGTVFFNEMAPRPHNSGHLSIELCDTSQFEQYIRAACNLPFGSPQFHSCGFMENILGDEAKQWALQFADRRGSVHLYGKDIRPGRKMGHVTVRTIPKA